jgi:hypothetical protein
MMMMMVVGWFVFDVGDGWKRNEPGVDAGLVAGGM